MLFDLQETPAAKEERWRKYFNIEVFTTQKASQMGHKFAHFFSTDGISCSIKMSRLVSHLAAYQIEMKYIPASGNTGTSVKLHALGVEHKNITFDRITWQSYAVLGFRDLAGCMPLVTVAKDSWANQHCWW